MKHPSNRAYFAYWDGRRGHASAPDRSDIEPSAVRELLGDIFVLSYDHDGGHPFRVAGTRLCALAGCDVKDTSFAALFTPPSRREIDNIITAVCEKGATAHLELLLLPFNNRAHAPLSLTGLLAPFESDFVALTSFQLTSWRYLHPPPQKLMPRALRKLAIARGFMVYEGLR